MTTSLQEKETPNLFLSPIIHKTPADIQTRWNEYIDLCLESRTVPTKAGACSALRIYRNEWDKLKEHPTLGFAINWMELDIMKKWEQLLASKVASGASVYLKNNFKENYSESIVPLGETPVPILNLSVHFTSVNNKILEIKK